MNARVVMGQVRVLAVWVIIGLLAATQTQAACTQVQPGWLWNYDGAINEKYRVRMTLVFGAGEINGVYFYASQLRDLRLKGRIEQSSKLVLDELDPAGKVTGRIEAQFVTRDPRGRYGDSELACEVIVGTWSKPDGTGRMPLYLSMDGGTAGALNRRYAAIGVRDDEIVHRGAQKFWRAVRSDDRAAVAASIRYPIRVMLDGKPVGLKGAEELLARYDAIFTPAYREAIAKGLPRNMFVRDQGAMLGSGEVWFGADGRVTAVSNV
ncbi:MAG: hypothetical protein ACKODA_01820 [Nevskiaceae bacterium]